LTPVSGVLDASGVGPGEELSSAAASALPLALSPGVVPPSWSDIFESGLELESLPELAPGFESPESPPDSDDTAEAS
jgi:hypothetical protein